VIIELLEKREGRLLRRAHKVDVGWDVFSEQDVYLYPHQTKRVPLGFGLDLPNDTWAEIKTRSSLAARGVIIGACPIDPGYTGEIYAIVHNLNSEDIVLPCDKAIGQLVFHNRLDPGFLVSEESMVEDLDRPPRKTGAFGSTDGLNANGMAAKLQTMCPRHDKKHCDCDCNCGGECKCNPIDTDYAGE
jgi:dUTP pyrophosphatase